MADRIQARAVRRMGELLKQFDGRGEHRRSVGTHTSSTQKQIAEAARISDHQRVQAVRVANVPQEKFEAAIEAEKPAPSAALLDEKLAWPRPPHRASACGHGGAEADARFRLP
ncbi:hypothetical protein [Nitrobacter sp. TKz-YC02]|uniref:hypothetical protein n=1 Tax=Nitrobacter sp. TKz-YC02 TaxID=3398704 RepID=UPI003CF538A6